MAARLILRGCRLMVASASFQPLPATVRSEGARLCQMAPSVLPRASLHTSSLCSLADSLPGVSEEPSTDNGKEFLSTVRSAPTLKDLLMLATTRKLNGNKSCMVIGEIIMRNIQDKQEILHDKRFKKLLKVANKQIHTVWDPYLILLLKSLYWLGMDKSPDLLSVETELRWRLRRLSIDHLARLSFCLDPLNSSCLEGGTLLAEVVKQAELRWTEIKKTNTLTQLFRMCHLSEALRARLEDKVLELAEQLTPTQIQTVILTLAMQNRRSLAVLHAMSFHLERHPGKFSPLLIVCIVNSFAKLNYIHDKLLDRMAKDIIPNLPEIAPNDITILTRSFSLLKWSNVPLCEGIAQNCIKQRETFSSIHFCHFIMNFANLNFLPTEEFFSMVHQRPISQLDLLPFIFQLDFVFGLCILNRVTTPYLQRVLEPQFYNRILEDSSPKSTSHCKKLLQINSTAQLECSDYQGPLLPSDVQQRLMAKVQSQSCSKLQKSVKEILKIIYPESGTCRFNYLPVYGCYVDCEVVLDSEYNALPLNDFVAPHYPQCTGTLPLPEGARRLAILCRDFSTLTFNTKELLGRYVMARRHLLAAGFLVVEVPEHVWQEQKSSWLKQAYLKSQIMKVVAEDVAR